MLEKSPRFQEWLEKFNRFMDESIAELRYISVKARRARGKEKTKGYHLPIQVICRDIVRGLSELYDIKTIKPVTAK